VRRAKRRIAIQDEIFYRTQSSNCRHGALSRTDGRNSISAPELTPRKTRSAENIIVWQDVVVAVRMRGAERLQLARK